MDSEDDRDPKIRDSNKGISDLPEYELGYQLHQSVGEIFMCQHKQETRKPPETVHKLCEEGLVLIKHKHYADALSCFEQVVELDANHAEAWFRIGCCRSEIAKQKIENAEVVLGVREESEIYEPAIYAYLKAIELRRDLADARGSLAELFYDYFDCSVFLGGAKEAYQKVIELQPDCAGARKFLAELFYDYAERKAENAREEEGAAFIYTEAIDWCKQAVEICPQMLEACCQQMVLIYTLWMDDAIHETQMDDEDLPSEICMNVGEAGKALIESHQKLIQIRPNDFNAYYELGNAHRMWVDVTISTSEYLDRHFGHLDRDEIEAMTQGNTPFTRENLKKAIEAYRTTVGIKPDNADAYSALAESCQWIGQLEEAIQAFKQAIVHGNREHSNLAKTYHKLGKKHSDNGKYTEAIECYHNAIVTDPKNVEVYYDLALAYDEAGIYELAIVWYQRVRSTHANLRHDAGHYESVINECARIEDSYEYPDLHYRLGKAYHRIFNYQDAIKAYGTAINRQIAIEEEYNRKSYYERYDSDPPARPQWWTEVYQNHESASQNEPL